MDTKKLRQKILDLAIIGKLVPQDPNDEPASVLLERIRAEKERLIAEGKIKRPKKSKASSSESHYQNFEPPFEIPESWEWVRLDDICEIKGGKRIPLGRTFSLTPTPYIYIRVTNMKSNTISCEDLKYIDASIRESIKNYTISKNDLYLTIAGTIGSVGVVPDEFDGMNLTENAAKLTSIQIDKKYLMYSLLSTSTQEHFISRFHQVAQPKLSIETASSTMIPLPPQSEQVRIVNFIDKVIAQIENIQFNSNILSQKVLRAKSKILELAMHGKLVPQDPTDEPAAEMLKRINPKAKIITDNPHYTKLPDNWVLTDIQSISNYGKCNSVDIDYLDEDDWILELEDIEKDSGFILEKKRKGDREVKGIRHSFISGDILYSKLRTYLNKVLIAPNSGYCSTEIIPIKCHESVINQYLCAWLRSPFFLTYSQSCGYGVKMPRLSTSDAKNGIVPLPPLNEQRRIMEHVNSLFEALDSISNFVHYL